MNERALNTPTCGRRLFSTLLAIVSITATFGCASSAPPAIPDPTPPPASETALGSEIERIERYVEDRMESQGTVGLTIGFIKGDQMWVHGFGYADLENGVAAIPESSYRMASVTKPMTAIGILTLVDAARLTSTPRSRPTFRISRKRSTRSPSVSSSAISEGSLTTATTISKVISRNRGTRGRRSPSSRISISSRSPERGTATRAMGSICSAP